MNLGVLYAMNYLLNNKLIHFLKYRSIVFVGVNGRSYSSFPSPNKKFLFWKRRTLVNNGENKCSFPIASSSYSRFSTQTAAKKTENHQYSESSDEKILPSELVNKFRQLREVLVLQRQSESRRVSNEGTWYRLRISFINFDRITLKINENQTNRNRMRGDKKLLGVVAVRQFLSKDKREYFDFSVPFKGDHIVYLECEKTFPFECKLGQSLQLRGLSSFERDLYKIIKIFSHPPEWWLVQPGFQSMLYFLGIKEMPSKTSAQYSSVNVPSVNGIQFNHEQSQAFSAAIDSSNLFVGIHGPPASGKTFLAAEIASKLLNEGKRLLVFAFINESMEKFLKECQNHQLDEGSILIVNGCRDNLRNHKNLARSHPDASKRSEIFTKISNILKKDLRQLNDSEKLIKTREFLSLKEELKIIDKKIYADILSSTKVLIFASENDIDQYIEMGFKPDAQIVLNLNYCVEHQFLNIIRQTPRTIIIGDLYSKVMLQQVSNISPIHRLNQSGKSEFHSLVTQYRSNATLVEWPNEVFYNGQIKTDESVANLRLSDLLETQSIESSDPVYDLFENTDENKSNEVEKVKTASTNDELSLVNNLLKQQIVFVDLDQARANQASFYQPAKYVLPKSNLFERFNLGGNLLLAKYTRILLERGVKPHQIGIIVQSFAERSMLSILLDPICTKIGIDRKNLVIGSEFDFVGRELSREVILKSDLSLDDSNSLSVSLYPHRLSASLLTASRQLFIVGRESHFKKEEMFELNNFMQLVREKGTIMAPDDLVSTESIEKAKKVFSSRNTNRSQLPSRRSSSFDYNGREYTTKRQRFRNTSIASNRPSGRRQLSDFDLPPALKNRNIRKDEFKAFESNVPQRRRRINLEEERDNFQPNPRQNLFLDKIDKMIDLDKIKNPRQNRQNDRRASDRSYREEDNYDDRIGRRQYNEDPPRPRQILRQSEPAERWEQDYRDFESDDVSRPRRRIPMREERDDFQRPNPIQNRRFPADRRAPADPYYGGRGDYEEDRFEGRRDSEYSAPRDYDEYEYERRRPMQRRGRSENYYTHEEDEDRYEYDGYGRRPQIRQRFRDEEEYYDDARIQRRYSNNHYEDERRPTHQRISRPRDYDYGYGREASPNAYERKGDHYNDDLDDNDYEVLDTDGLTWKNEDYDGEFKRK